MTLPLRVALLGLGTVGAQVARGLTHDGARLAASSGGRELRLVVVADPDPDRPQGVDLEGIERVADGGAVVARRDIDVVVELIGGTGIAGDLVVRAIQSGTSVVTANKALLARRGAELERLAREQGVALRFEAAVGGGIPILAPLGGDLAANRFDRVRGIVNGSTNYVLTALHDGAESYEAAVAKARALGYLEADPRTDIEAADAADKLTILARVAFGAWPDVTAIRRAPPALTGDGPPGIAGVSAALVDAARRNGLTMKLVADGARRPDGRIAASVLPCAVPSGWPLARTSGVENRIELEGEPIGRLAFAGPGAGGAATSSAILGDLLALARGEGSTWAGLAGAGPLAAGLLDDGLEHERRWLRLDSSGQARVTGRTTLAELRRATPAGTGPVVFFPILDEA